MAMRIVSLVASTEKDLGKRVNAKRKEISTKREDLAAPAYRTWKEKKVNGKIPEFFKFFFIILLFFLLLIQGQSTSHMPF